MIHKYIVYIYICKGKMFTEFEQNLKKKFLNKFKL